MSVEALAPECTRAAARHLLARRFREAGIESHELDARILVCAACAIDHVGLIREPDEPLGDAAAEAISAMALRRCAREPVSRILGCREFWGAEFTVSPAVLDPRPETEVLIAAVVETIGGRRDETLKVLDLGTGSGAILCALLLDLPYAEGVGVDRSFEACLVALRNARRFGLERRSAFICADWLDAITPAPPRPFDVIVSNPPYVRTGEIAALDPEVRAFDPYAALDGGDDGLDPYRRIMPLLRKSLAPDGVVAFECGHDQGAEVAGLMRHHGVGEPKIRADLAGRDRVVIATL